MNCPNHADYSDAEEAFSNNIPKREQTQEERITNMEKEIVLIKHNCENHKVTSQRVFNELQKLQAEFRAIKDSMKEITIVKNVVESINLILAKRNSILPNGAKTGIKDVNWMSIAKGIGLIIAMAASAYFGGSNVQ